MRQVAEAGRGPDKLTTAGSADRGSGTAGTGGGAEAGTRTPMSVRSLRPEVGGCMAEPRVMLAFRVVNSMASFAEVL